MGKKKVKINSNTEQIEIYPSFNPKYEEKLYLAIIFLIPLIYFFKALSPSNILFGSDWMTAGYALRDFIHYSVTHYHQFPLWNPYVFGGMPVIDAFYGDLFYLTTLFRLFIQHNPTCNAGRLLDLLSSEGDGFIKKIIPHRCNNLYDRGKHYLSSLSRSRWQNIYLCLHPSHDSHDIKGYTNRENHIFSLIFPFPGILSFRRPPSNYIHVFSDLFCYSSRIPH